MALDNGRAGLAIIDIRIGQVLELFDSLDPYPFGERDLDRDVEAYILAFARELPGRRPIGIVVHLPAEESRLAEAGRVAPAVKRHFEAMAGGVDRELRELFRVGRLSLVIGLSVLALCALIDRLFLEGVVSDGSFIREGIIIVGWVANWRPIEIFLYEWWPLVRRRNLYRRLATATVELMPYAG